MVFYGEKLKELRKAAGLSQAELAKMVGCAQSTIFWLEKGNRLPHRSLAQRVANALNVPISELCSDNLQEQILALQELLRERIIKLEKEIRNIRFFQETIDRFIESVNEKYLEITEPEFREYVDKVFSEAEAVLLSRF